MKKVVDNNLPRLWKPPTQSFLGDSFYPPASFLKTTAWEATSVEVLVFLECVSLLKSFHGSLKKFQTAMDQLLKDSLDGV